MRLKRVRRDGGVVGEEEAGAGREEEGEVERMPRSQRLTRQKLSREVNRMNQPDEDCQQGLRR